MARVAFDIKKKKNKSKSYDDDKYTRNVATFRMGRPDVFRDWFIPFGSHPPRPATRTAHVCASHSTAFTHSQRVVDVLVMPSLGRHRLDRRKRG